MRIGDVLYFSPRFRFSDLDVDDSEKLIEALQDRLMGFYLAPASRLLGTGDAFAAGLLCCTAIDFVALCSGDEHPDGWLRKNIPDFGDDEALAGNFWNWFRHGLVHEGRIKAFGQFSLDFPRLLNVVGPALVVNPQLLLEAIQGAFQSYFEQLDETQSARLVKRLQRYFRAEIAAARE
jgi:hypothetical protein